MIRDIPHFELGYTTNGAGDPVDDTAIAFSDVHGIERELKLDGEGAIDLMPIIVQAVNSYDEMGASLREVREWISNWSPNFEQDEEWPAVRRRMDAAIAKAEGQEPSDV
jgi:hypothetical protein